jgi:hypothetical protein
LLEWLSSRTSPTTNVGKDVRKKESSYTIDRNKNYYNHYRKQYGGPSKKSKNTTTI